MSEYPSLPEQAKNLAQFGWDMLQHVYKNQNATLFVSDEVYNERTKICSECDHFDPEQNRCKECGCFIPAKAKMILDGCPLSKWTEDKDSWDKQFESIIQEIEKKEE